MFQVTQRVKNQLVSAAGFSRARVDELDLK